jgi:hypothetical protein
MIDPMIASMDTVALVSRFIQLSENQTESNSSPSGGEAWQQLAAVAEELVRRGEQGEIVRLARDPRIPVKFYAGLFCDDFAPETLRKALIAVARDETHKWLCYQAKFHLAMRFRDYHEKVYAESQRMVRKEDRSKWDSATWIDALRATARKDPQQSFERYDQILTDSASSEESDGS